MIRWKLAIDTLLGALGFAFIVALSFAWNATMGAMI